MLRGDPGVLREKSCFHFQQAAEKALKAVLIRSGVDFPRIHDISELVELLSSSGVIVLPEVRDADILTPYAVQTRYPADLPDIPDEELDAAQAAATRVVTWAETIVETPTSDTDVRAV